jgi:hypothetical protein
MSKRASIWAIGVSSVALLVSSGWAAPLTKDYAGEILAVDRATGKIVVGDMGPLLDDGQSRITRRSIRVTSSTEFASVKRAERIAPSGWNGDYVENSIPAWDVKPGDFVAVKVTEEGGAAALKIIVVDTSAQ